MKRATIFLLSLLYSSFAMSAKIREPGQEGCTEGIEFMANQMERFNGGFYTVCFESEKTLAEVFSILKGIQSYQWRDYSNDEAGARVQGRAGGTRVVVEQKDGFYILYVEQNETDPDLQAKAISIRDQILGLLSGRQIPLQPYV